MYTDTVTLFCRYDSRLGITWYPNVLKNVNLSMDKAAIVDQYGAESRDNAILNVRYQLVDGKKIIGEKQWLSPKEWDGQTNDLLSDTITFTSGQKFDFFWLGQWPDEQPVSDNAYGIDGFYSYMNSKYDHVFSITSVGGPFGVIPHFEITGK